jgi:hypothetical protein
VIQCLTFLLQVAFSGLSSACFYTVSAPKDIMSIGGAAILIIFMAFGYPAIVMHAIFHSGPYIQEDLKLRAEAGRFAMCYDDNDEVEHWYFYDPITNTTQWDPPPQFVYNKEERPPGIRWVDAQGLSAVLGRFRCEEQWGMMFPLLQLLLQLMNAILVFGLLPAGLPSGLVLFLMTCGYCVGTAYHGATFPLRDTSLGQTNMINRAAWAQWIFISVAGSCSTLHAAGVQAAELGFYLFSTLAVIAVPLGMAYDTIMNKASEIEEAVEVEIEEAEAEAATLEEETIGDGAKKTDNVLVDANGETDTRPLSPTNTSKLDGEEPEDRFDFGLYDPDDMIEVECTPSERQDVMINMRVI